MAIYQYQERQKNRSLILLFCVCVLQLFNEGIYASPKETQLGSSASISCWFDNAAAYTICSKINEFPSDKIESTFISIIPKPQSLIVTKGTFILTEKTVILSELANDAIAIQLAKKITASTGYLMTVKKKSTTINNSINLKIDSSLQNLGGEGYTLEVKPNQVNIRAYKAAGLFYGC